MNTVHLNALNLNVEVSDDRQYYDDGYTGSIYAYQRSLFGRYGFLEDFEREGKTYKNHLGISRCFRPHEAGTRFVHIGYLKVNSEVDDLFIRAHEEMHALKRLGKSSALNPSLKRLRKEVILLKNPDEEVVCSIGGLVACTLKGFDISKIDPSIQKNDHFQTAKGVLEF